MGVLYSLLAVGCGIGLGVWYQLQGQSILGMLLVVSGGCVLGCSVVFTVAHLYLF